MKTVNSVSGGRTSSFMAIKTPADINIFSVVCIEKKSNILDKSLLQWVNDKLEKSGTILHGEFVNTAEHPLTLYAVKELEQILGKEIVWVRGKSFDKVIDEGTKTRLPSWARRYYTVEMKLRPIAEYCWWRFGKVAMNIGFRFDEQERIRPDSNFKLQLSSPLLRGSKEEGLPKNAKYSSWKEVDWRVKQYPILQYTHQDVIKEMKKYNIRFPKNSNCQGCFHKPAEIIKDNFQDAPEQMQWFALQELKNKGTWRDDKVTYSQIAHMNFTERLFVNDGNYTMCDSGGCTD